MAIEQPLINLIDNAIYHLRESPCPTITISIQIEQSDARTPLHILVEDNGPGIAYPQVQRLFQPMESTKGIGAVGMGLYASRNLLRSIEGDLDLVRTVRWFGSCFRIKLPIRLADMEKSGDK
jgi:C4-dicarboxylate-specific signal transduction histidine kinase